MKIFNVATFTALLAIAYSKGSEAKEPSQLIGKAGNDDQLEPKNALAYFLHAPSERFFGSGAILSRTCVIVPFIIFSDYFNIGEWHISLFRAVIGTMPFIQSSQEYQHHVYDIKHNISPNCNKEDAIALVIIKPTSNHKDTPPPSWVQHIPLATQSYIPGQHTVSEFIVGWDELYVPRKIPIYNLNVDNEGIISAQIRVGYNGKYLGYFKRNLGAFITRKGTLAGLAFKHEPVTNVDEPVTFYFVPIHGNHPLIRIFGDQGIQIKDIDSSGSSNKRRRMGEGPSNNVEVQNNELYI